MVKNKLLKNIKGLGIIKKLLKHKNSLTNKTYCWTTKNLVHTANIE